MIGSEDRENAWEDALEGIEESLRQTERELRELDRADWWIDLLLASASIVVALLVGWIVYGRGGW